MITLRSLMNKMQPSDGKDKRRISLLSLLPFVLAGLTLLPVAVVAASLLSPSVDVWIHLWDTILPTLLSNTFVLLIGVSSGTLVLGTGLAWLICAYDFPGKKIFKWLLILPMAIPAYVMGFIYMGLFDFAGPIQTFFRALGWENTYFPQIRSGAGAIFVMILVLYPYVFLLARAGFEEQSGSAYEAAKALGCGKLGIFFKIALPLARPSIAAGVALASMEALADFATVRYFNFPTISDGVLRVWHGMMNLDAASEMAVLLAVFAMGVVMVERKMRSRRSYQQNKGKQQGFPTVTLEGAKGIGAMLLCIAVVLLAFGIPVAQLLYWASKELTEVTPAALRVYARLAMNSLTLSLIAAGSAVTLALLMVSMSRLSAGKLKKRLTQLVTIGYSIPGAVIGVGILISLAAADNFINVFSERVLGIPTGLVFVGSLMGLIYAYIVRFMAIAHNSVDASMDKIPPNTVLAARSLGASPLRTLMQVKIPLMLPGILAGAVLVFVDVMKELPITVLLRPLGYDTLAIWIWQMAAESLWTDTALPALFIVLVGLLPIRVLSK